MKIQRRANTIVSDWKADAKVVATRARIAELDEFIGRANDRLARHDGVVSDLTDELTRAELLVLAGKGTDAQLAQVQARHIQARRERAIELIAVEDARSEREKLLAQLPGIASKAQAVAHAAIQARGIALLKEMRAAISTLAQTEGDYSALVSDAENQFPQTAYNQPDAELYDRSLRTRAGLHILRESRTNGRRQESISVEGATANFALEIDELLEQLAK